MAVTPRDDFLATGGIRLHYRDWGGRGQPIVLLHGLASSCHIWDLVASILGDGFSVVTLDQRGHGESEKPDHGYDFATMIADLHRFIQAQGLERPLLAGHSWGGDVVLEYAVAHPEVARGLCLVEGGTIEISSRPGYSLAQAKEAMAPPDFTGVNVDRFRERVRSRSYGGWAVSSEIEEIVLANFEVLADNTVRARLSRENHMQIIEAFWEHRPSTLYGHVECPVLLMPARQSLDEARSERQLRREESIATAARLLPNSRTVWLEDSIHDVPLQRPDLVAGVIRDGLKSGFFG